MSELMIAANPTASKSETAPAQKAEKPAAAKVVKPVAAKAEKPAAAKVEKTVAQKIEKPADGKATAQQAAAQGKAVVEVPDKPNNGEENKKDASSPWLSMLPFILIFVVMIFFMNRSQKKQMAKRQEMMDSIAKGTKVILSSGIYGTVEAVHNDSMIVEIASGVRIKVAKSGIAGIDAPEAGEKKAEDK